MNTWLLVPRQAEETLAAPRQVPTWCTVHHDVDPYSLPVGWFRATSEHAKRLLDELRRELPVGHLLYGIRLEAFAHRAGATDDVLFRHLDDPDRFTVVHLTWLGRTEIDAHHPGVECDGTFEDFLAYEATNWGLEPPSDE